MADAFHVASPLARPVASVGRPAAPSAAERAQHRPAAVAGRSSRARGVGSGGAIPPAAADTDLRLAPAAPPPEAAFSLFSPPPLAGAAAAVGRAARARLGRDRPLLDAAHRVRRVASLAGGAVDAHFIAPAEHMKRLFTPLHSEGRVAFPVHNIGGSLVVDGDAAGWESAAAERVTDAAAGEAEAALVDALGHGLADGRR